MDTFALKQEQSELLKSVAELKYNLEAGEKRIKDLHEEEMVYLKEIPEYKKQAEDARLKMKNELKKLADVSIELSRAHDQLKENNEALSKSNQDMQQLSMNSEIILNNIQIEKEEVRKMALDAKNRESACGIREMDCANREEFNRKVDSDLDKREFDLKKLKEEIADKEKVLSDNIDAHNLNVENHLKKVDALIEAKESHKQDESELANKSFRLDKLIKDNLELKAALLLQSDKLSKEITITQGKQVSLDRSLADLVNQENILKIKDLKIKKMAHDAGLEKELKDLEASLK